jgi:hypothetical protein
MASGSGDAAIRGRYFDRDCTVSILTMFEKALLELHYQLFSQQYIHLSFMMTAAAA